MNILAKKIGRILKWSTAALILLVILIITAARLWINTRTVASVNPIDYPWQQNTNKEQLNQTVEDLLEQNDS
jgi:hypothetical protein